MKNYLFSVLKGAIIGVAMIIPGVSGGSLAVILGIYQDMINAINNLRKDFKNSVKFLLPIGIGLVLAFAAMYFPLTLALEYIPFQTIMLFGGLMLGTLPKIFIDSKKNGFQKKDIIAVILPAVAVIGLCFIPNIQSVNLGEGMGAYQYPLLILIGMLASCALVVPGISGSMLLMILGYYEPILNTFKNIFTMPLQAIGVLGCTFVGIVIGFFTISKVMKVLFDKYPRVTNWAITSFVAASIPALVIIFLSNDLNRFKLDGVSITLGILVFIFATCISFILTKNLDEMEKKKLEEQQALEETSDNIPSDKNTNVEKN